MLHENKGLPREHFKRIWDDKQKYTLEALGKLPQSYQLQECMFSLVNQEYKLAVCSKECGYDINYFWHEEDTLTLTSHNYLWVYPGKQPIKNSIAVLPELFQDDVSECLGVCSDFIKKYEDATFTH